MAAHFHAQGYAFASINYRLVPDATVDSRPRTSPPPSPAWSATPAARHRSGPDHRIGHSAGAHLAALVGTDPRYLAAHRLPVTAIDGIVLLDGAGYDVPAQMERGGPFLRRLYASAFGDDAAFQAPVSPTRTPRRPMPAGS